MKRSLTPEAVGLLRVHAWFTVSFSYKAKKNSMYLQLPYFNSSHPSFQLGPLSAKQNRDNVHIVSLFESQALVLSTCLFWPLSSRNMKEMA